MIKMGLHLPSRGFIGGSFEIDEDFFLIEFDDAIDLAGNHFFIAKVSLLGFQESRINAFLPGLVTLVIRESFERGRREIFGDVLGNGFVDFFTDNSFSLRESAGFVVMIRKWPYNGRYSCVKLAVMLYHFYTSFLNIVDFNSGRLYYQCKNEKGDSHMKLQDYLLEEKIDPVRFAVDNGFGVASIYRYLKGKRPRFLIAVAIERATKGKVTIKDLRGREVW
jgi:hypothetical protein